MEALGTSLLRPATRPEDVDAWEAEVEAALRHRPRDIGLFHYDPPRSPLEALSASVISSSPLRRRLRQRLRQLETIMDRIP